MFSGSIAHASLSLAKMTPRAFERRPGSLPFLQGSLDITPPWTGAKMAEG